MSDNPFAKAIDREVLRAFLGTTANANPADDGPILTPESLSKALDVVREHRKKTEVLHGAVKRLIDHLVAAGTTRGDIQGVMLILPGAGAGREVIDTPHGPLEVYHSKHAPRALVFPIFDRAVPWKRCCEPRRGGST